MRVKRFLDRLRTEMQLRIFLPDQSSQETKATQAEDNFVTLWNSVAYVAGSFTSLGRPFVIDRTILDQKKEKKDFAREVQRLIYHKIESDSIEGLCRQIGLDKSYLYKMMKGEKTPSRDLCIRISLSLRLDRAEADKLISLLGYGLFEYVKRDFVLLRCLDEQLDPFEVDEVLTQMGLSPLK